jgi:hypothetical protein
MGARTKLNRIATIACVLLAGILGAASGSWCVFVVVLACLLGLCLYSREIRPDRRSQSPHHSQGRRRKPWHR